MINLTIMHECLLDCLCTIQLHTASKHCLFFLLLSFRWKTNVWYLFIYYLHSFSSCLIIRLSYQQRTRTRASMRMRSRSALLSFPVALTALTLCLWKLTGRKRTIWDPAVHPGLPIKWLYWWIWNMSSLFRTMWDLEVLNIFLVK